MYSKVLLIAMITCGMVVPAFAGESRTTNQTVEYQDSSIQLDAIPVGEPMVDFTLPDFFTGENYTLSEIQTGKLVMLDFMASWCGPCKEAMPEIKQLYNTFHPGGQFEIISVDVDDKKGDPDSDVRNFYYTYGVEWPFARDQPYAVNGTQFAWHYYGTGFIPTMYLIFEGKVVYQEVGFAGYDAIKSIVLQYIGGDDAAPSINSFTEKQELSIDHPYLDLEVNVTDNWAVEEVALNCHIQDVDVDAVFEYNETLGLWRTRVDLPLEALYKATEVKVDYMAKDYFGNKVSASKSYAVTHIEDTSPPSVEVKDIIHYSLSATQDIIFVIDARDNYLVKEVVVVEILNGVETRHEAYEGSKEHEYRFKLSLPVETDLSQYSFKVEVKDLGDHLVSMDINLLDYGFNFSVADTHDDSTKAAAPVEVMSLTIGLSLMVAVVRRRSSSYREQ